MHCGFIYGHFKVIIVIALVMWDAVSLSWPPWIDDNPHLFSLVLKIVDIPRSCPCCRPYYFPLCMDSHFYFIMLILAVYRSPSWSGCIWDSQLMFLKLWWLFLHLVIFLDFNISHKILLYYSVWFRRRNVMHLLLVLEWCLDKVSCPLRHKQVLKFALVYIDSSIQE